MALDIWTGNFIFKYNLNGSLLTDEIEKSRIITYSKEDDLIPVLIEIGKAFIEKHNIENTKEFSRQIELQWRDFENVVKAQKWFGEAMGMAERLLERKRDGEILCAEIIG